MRIEAIDAESFGPFKGERLELPGGMTIVHGPNEAGKSSWFAALYAGLCGIRRSRGRGTVAQREFKARHQPWGRRMWRVGVDIALEDGRRLRIAHNLLKGDTTVVNLATSAPLPASVVRDFEYEGMFDGAGLVGLNRDSARATIFVAQADVLRVLASADELQELLQRAASTSTMDTTVEHAIGVIKEQLKTAVGQEHLAKRPLGAAMAAWSDATAAADTARDAHDELLALLEQGGAAATELDEASRAVEQLERLVEWRAVLELERQVKKVHDLEGKIAAQGELAALAGEDVVRAVTERLGAFRDRGDEPGLPDGKTAEEIGAELEALPAAPTGDTAVSDDITSARDELLAARAEVVSHREGEVADVSGAELSNLDADELRALAASLEQSVPEDPTELREQLASARANRASGLQAHEKAMGEWRVARDQHRAAVEAHADAVRSFDAELARHEAAVEAASARPAVVPEGPSAPVASRGGGRVALVAGGLLTIVGIVLLAIGFVAVGVAAIIIGLGAGLAGLGARNTSHGDAASTLPEAGPRAPLAPGFGLRPVPPPPLDVADPGEPPEQAVLDGTVERLEAQLAQVEQARTLAAAAHALATGRATELGLQPDPDGLRQTARDVEGAAGASERRDRWTERLASLEAKVSSAEERLLALIRGREPDIPQDDSADEALSSYVQAVRARGQQAKESARRGDLVEQLATREQAEASYSTRLAIWQAAEAALVETAVSVGLSPSVGEEAAALRVWLEEQARLQRAHATRAELEAALSQALDDHTSAELATDLAEEFGRLGERPDVVPEGVEAALERARERRDALIERGAGVGGRLDAGASGAAHPAEAIEREAEARHRLAEVRALEVSLKLAEHHLQEAKVRVNSNIAPVLTASIRPWLPRVTDGRYTDVNVRPESLTLEVRGPDGEYRDASVLSHGTTEQAYLLLRLALADHLSDGDERLPVFLDDVTVQSDAHRTLSFLDLLHEISRDRQVVLFSQEEEVAEWGRQALTGSRDRFTVLD